MEDIIQYIFYFIIIISFLSSFFKKKKPEAPKDTQSGTRPSQTRSYPEPKSYPAPNSQPLIKETSSPTSDEYAILREIERMFKTSSEPEKPSKYPPQTSGMETIKRTTRIEEHKQRQMETKQTPDETLIYRSEMDRAPVTSEHSGTSSEHIMGYSKKPTQISKEMEELAGRFESNLKNKRTRNIIAIEIQESLRHPQKLKNYFIISEILGKPKAFE